MHDRSPKVFFGDGALAALPALLDEIRVERLFIVAGRKSWAASGAEHLLLPHLDGVPRCSFSDFSPNPHIEDIAAGMDRLRADGADAVLAVGGGTAMDLAKSIALLSAQDGPPEAYVKGPRAPEHPRRCRLFLVPTTSGTGSEVTSFAVAYIGSRKYSLDHPELLADAAFVDPSLTSSMPRALTATTGVDALSQAMESYWCVNSTAVSRRYATQALRLILANLEPACNQPTPKSRRAMSEAALLAGRAINITRTTAPHAVSYPITALHGIPHGHACGLTLPQFLLFNAGTNDEDVLDRRGAAFVRQRIANLLDMLGVRTPEQGCRKLTELIAAIGLGTKLSELGIGEAGIQEIVARGFNPDRVKNNPRRLTKEALNKLLERVR